MCLFPSAVRPHRDTEMRNLAATLKFEGSLQVLFFLRALPLALCIGAFATVCCDGQESPACRRPCDRSVGLDELHGGVLEQSPDSEEAVPVHLRDTAERLHVAILAEHSVHHSTGSLDHVVFAGGEKWSDPEAATQECLDQVG